MLQQLRSCRDGVVFARRHCVMPIGFSEEDLPHEAVTAPDKVLSFGMAPARVELTNHIDAVRFDDAKPNAVRGAHGSQEVSFIGRDGLIRNKRASGREQVQVDVDQMPRTE